MSKVTISRRRWRLKRQLKAIGLTQARIAAEAGVHVTAVNHFLNGRMHSRLIGYVIRRLLEEAEACKGHDGGRS